VSATPNGFRLVVLALALTACGGQPAGSATAAVPTTTVPVVRTNIVSTLQLDGTLTYAGSCTVVNRTGPGTYTALPAPGAVVTRGQVLYRVDSRPIPLLYGDPEWRTLAIGVGIGADVKQLEENLLALGFANSGNLIANGRFDAYDAAAVRRWQRWLGVAQTGTLNLGDFVFEPGPVRIAVVDAAAGTLAAPGQPVIEATSTQHVVTVALDVSREGSVKVGDQVEVVLPTSTTVEGSIESIGTVAVAAPTSGGQSGPATVPVTVSLADPSAGGTLDQAPVTVGVTDAVHDAVLAVPVTALLAEPGGTFAVEVVDGSGRRLVTVATGLFDDRGLVEVTSSELREGMSVEVPQI